MKSAIFLLGLAMCAQAYNFETLDVETADVSTVLEQVLLKINDHSPKNNKEVEGMKRLIVQLEKRLLDEGAKEKEDLKLNTEEYDLAVKKIDTQNEKDKAKIAQIKSEQKGDKKSVEEQLKMIGEIRKFLSELSPEARKTFKEESKELLEPKKEEVNLVTIKKHQGTQQILEDIMVNLQRPHAEVAGMHELLDALEARLKSEDTVTTSEDSALLANLESAIEDRISQLQTKKLEQERRLNIYNKRSEMRERELKLISLIKQKLEDYLKIQ